MADAQPPKQPENQKGPTRIQVNRIWLYDEARIDLPGGHSLMTVIDCSPPKSTGRQFFVAHFVPAHQVIELEWWKSEKAEPYRTRIPISAVKHFD